MQEYVVQGALGLSRGSLLRIEDGQDLLVYVWEGALWLTEDGEARDRLLRAGDWHRVARQGATVGYALERSMVTLTSPQPAYPAHRIALTKAGSATPVVLYSAARERAATLRAWGRWLWTGLFAPRSRPTSASL
jgi:hypothetical protein